MTPRTPGAVVTVVLCCFDEKRWPDLTAALEAVRRQTAPPGQVVVVVDHNESLLHLVRETWGSQVQVVPSAGQPGLSGARNTGIEMATGEIIAFLDDDAVPADDWIAQLVQPFDEPEVVVAGGAVQPAWDGSRPRWWPEEFDWVVGCSYRGFGHEKTAVEVRNPIGANMAFRAAAFRSGLRFDDELGRGAGVPSGCEETELCIRISQERPGARVVLYPPAWVHHRVPVDRQRVSYYVRRCFHEGRSKAFVGHRVGTTAGLSAEWTYVARTLPSGIVRHLTATLAARDLHGAARAAMIVLGLLTTALGYAHGNRLSPRDPGSPEPWRPVRVLSMELTTGEVATVTEPAAGVEYSAARVLLRRSGRPVAVVDEPLTEGRLPPERQAALQREYAVEDDRPRVDRSATTRGPRLDVTVLIATRDRPDELHRCLRSLYAGDHPCFETVVVDNAPATDTTRRMLARDFPQVRYVREDIPGLAQAHNAGLGEIGTALVAITDDDVVLDRQWLSRIVDGFARSPDIACVTGLILPAQLDTRGQALVESCSGFSKGFAPRVVNLTTARPPDALFPYTTGSLGSGANMAFRTDVLRSLGAFDAALGAGSPGRGGDDLAAFHDVVAAGHSLLYEPAAIAYHFHRPEEGAVEAQSRVYGIGLGAYLTHVLVRRPRAAADFVRLAPAALRHLVCHRPGSPGAAASAQPRALTVEPALRRRLLLVQLAGIAQGPLAYLIGVRSRRTGQRGVR